MSKRQKFLHMFDVAAGLYAGTGWLKGVAPLDWWKLSLAVSTLFFVAVRGIGPLLERGEQRK